METRKDTFRHLLAEHHADAILLTALTDIRWATGFTGSHAVVLVLPNQWHFFSDGRYRVQAQQEVQEATIHIPREDIFQYLASEEWPGDPKKILIQSDEVTLSQWQAWKELFPAVEFIPAARLLTGAVARKDARARALVQQAQDLTDKVFTSLLDDIRPGVTEKELAAEIVYQHLRLGADRMSFDPIVASGIHGALPHARPTDKPFAQGDLIVIDMGCFVQGYASDMTRTVAVGEPGEEARRVYQVVLDAQQKALDTAHAGMTVNVLDAAAREVIAAAGYGDFFTHSLGHGVGLRIHEWPRVSYQEEARLEEGMVITIEPGIYLPGKFGIRIEDMIALTATGHHNFTRTDKTLLVV